MPCNNKCNEEKARGKLGGSADTMRHGENLQVTCAERKLDQSPFKVALPPVAAVLQTVIRCLQLHSKVDLCLPL